MLPITGAINFHNAPNFTSNIRVERACSNNPYTLIGSMSSGNNSVLSESQQFSGMSNITGAVLEEELQEKGAMFRDFLTSRVRLI